MQSELNHKIEAYIGGLDKKLVKFKSQADSKVEKLTSEFSTVLSSLKTGKYNKMARSSGSLLTGKSESQEMVLRRIDGLANEVKMMKLQMI